MIVKSRTSTKQCNYNTSKIHRHRAPIIQTKRPRAVHFAYLTCSGLRGSGKGSTTFGPLFRLVCLLTLCIVGNNVALIEEKEAPSSLLQWANKLRTRKIWGLWSGNPGSPFYKYDSICPKRLSRGKAHKNVFLGVHCFSVFAGPK